MGRGQRGGGGGGSQNVQVSSTLDIQNMKTERTRRDFSVEVIFSSLPYYVLSGWQSNLYVDKRKPYVAEHSVLNMSWSCPKGNGYEACKETIFIDCSLNNINTFSNGKNPYLTKYLGFAITRLKDLMYLKSKSYYGTVNIKIVAIHPCQKLMFALSALLGTQLSDSGVYSEYVSKILSMDEFAFTFRWIQQMGWEMKVQYCALFDCYKAVLEDTRGTEDREKELKRIIDNHKSGEDKVMYGGKKVPYDYVKEEYRKLTDPSSKELKAIYDEQCKNVEAVEKDAEKQRSQINKAMEGWDTPYNQKKVEIENLRKSSPEYKNKSDQELSQILQDSGLIDFQHIKWKTNYSDQYGDSIDGGLTSAMKLDQGEDKHAPVYMINGAPLDVYSIENRRKDIDQQVADAKAARDRALKAYNDKLSETFDTVLGAMQLLISVGSIAFPPLAVVDAVITVAKWAGGPECSTAENVANGMGVAMDIAGLIPYFGPVMKLSGKVAKESAKVIGKQTTKNVLKGLNQEVKSMATQGTKLSGISRNLPDGTAKQIKAFFNSQKGRMAEAVDTAAQAAAGVSTAYTVAVGIGYNGASYLIGLLGDFEFDPEIMKKKKKEVEKRRKEKPKYKNLSIQDQKSINGIEETNTAAKNLEKAKKSGDKEAIESAERQQDAANRLAESQFLADSYGSQESIKDAKKNLEQAKIDEQNAKTMLERQQNHTAEAELAKLQASGASNAKTAKRIEELKMEISNNYLYPDANRANYDQAVLNRMAAEQALPEAEQNDYVATMARINAQFAAQDLNYEKSKSKK